jgi:hypothetical protein
MVEAFTALSVWFYSNVGRAQSLGEAVANCLLCLKFPEALRWEPGPLWEFPTGDLDQGYLLGSLEVPNICKLAYDECGSRDYALGR